jgi:membrane-anchored protein YejM (alkaline phosphatase superfamily)
MLASKTNARTIWQYCLLTYPCLLLNAASYLNEIDYSGRITPFFVLAVYLTYTLIYLLPMLLLLLLLDRLLGTAHVERLLSKTPIRKPWLLGALAVLGLTLVEVVVFADKFIFHLYGFHLNGFVWNLVTTRGGIESLGGDPRTTLSFALIIVGLLAVQVVLLLLLMNVHVLQRVLDALSTKRAIIATASVVMLAGGFERITYAMSYLRGYTPVLLASNAFPFYVPTRMNSLAKSLGFAVARHPTVKVGLGAGGIQYPLRPIERRPVAKPYNIVFLVAESLRADALDPEIMPDTYAFAQKANWFKQHYSGGNGTRMAMFSMFYGLYGCYWFSFLELNRGPVLIDTMIDENYQMSMYTSAKFTYPEFDRTIFARISRDRLHEGELQPKWRRDRENVDLMLDFIEHRDPARPFMTFLFFESTHAKYYFPKETIIRTPYAEDLNYATMNVERDSQLIKNRYLNAARHLDTQFDRIVKYLTEHDLIDSTIVLITGDHGEEFMEKGHWGHNSTFDDEQTMTPMVLWVPGRAPRAVTHMTSHMDIPATLMPLLGVTNPPSDYSLGLDMLGDTVRDYAILSDWNAVAYVGEHYKAVFPVTAYDFSRVEVTTKDDRPVANRAEFYAKNRDRIVEIMKRMKVFSKPRGT